MDGTALSRQVHQLVIRLGTDQQNGPGAGGGVADRDIERRQQAGLGGVQIEAPHHRQLQLRLHQAGSAGPEHIGRRRANDDQLEVGGAHARCPYGGPCRAGRQGWRRQPLIGLDPVRHAGEIRPTRPAGSRDIGRRAVDAQAGDRPQRHSAARLGKRRHRGGSHASF